MATGQTLLNIMELLNQELQLQAGENDATRGLLALNIAQDHFESRAATRSKIGGSGVGTVSTTLNTESTAFPAGLLRLDALQLIDATTGRPKRDIVPLQRVGGHLRANAWPSNLISAGASGEPTHYWTDESNFYWSPLPNGAYTVRYYGFIGASDITASGTFSYKDMVMLPLASFAVWILKAGLEDSSGDVMQVARSTFDPVLDALELFRRDQAAGLAYTTNHSE